MKKPQTTKPLVSWLPDIVARFDREGRHLFVSDNISDLTGLPPGHFIGKTPRELSFDKESSRFQEEKILQAFATGLPSEHEFQVRGKNGPVVINWRLFPERDAKGEVVSVLSVCRDISEHRRLESDYRTLSQEMMDGFALHEIVPDGHGRPADYRFISVNPAFERMTGLKGGEIVGKTILTVLPDMGWEWLDAYGRAAQMGEPCHFKSFANGSERHFEIRAFRPAPDQLACLFRDMTASKKAGLELQGSHRRYKNLVETLPDIIYQVNPDGIFELVSPAVERVLGYTPEDLIGQHFSILLHPEDVERVSRNKVLPHFIGKVTGAANAPKLFDERRTAARMTRQLEVRLRPKKNRRAVLGEPWPSDVYGEVNAFGVYEGEINEENFKGTTGAIRDITEKKAFQEQLQQARKMEAIGTLADGIAHDFVNILGIQISFTQLGLMENRSVEKIHSYLKQISTASHRARGLVKQILAFSRNSRQKFEPVNVEVVVRDTLDYLSSAIPSHMEKQFSVIPNLGWVMGEKIQVQQILLNLCTNAIQAMEERGGTLTVNAERVFVTKTDPKCESGLSEGEHIVITVKDTGCGMDKKTLDRIFEPYFTTKKAGKAAGLGLSVAYSIVKTHRGAITAASEPGRGSSFQIFLPITPAPGEGGESNAPDVPPDPSDDAVD
ncbi:MAG: PAS domain S-box protein [Thermodesulfobacteriota bacterium]